MNPEARAHPGMSARFSDFWLLGGASLVVWLLCGILQLGRNDYFFVNARLGQVAAAFALLSLVCNHPHFMASYALAYGRGPSFWRRHWFALVLVPLALIALFAFSYFHLTDSAGDSPWTGSLNTWIAVAGLGYRFGETPALGLDLLGVAVWIMYLTVGWHYAKQAFGCAMVYANYDGYPIAPSQRRALKFGLFGLAAYSFFHLILNWREFEPSAGYFSFQGVPVTELGLPEWMTLASTVWLLAGITGILYFVVGRNYRRLGKWPSLNFLAPILALYAWWVPIYPQKEFYFMIVPFFHGLQYLPFAYRMDMSGRSRGPNWELWLALRLAVLFAAGFIAFEAMPGLIDLHGQSTLAFFSLSAAIFINVHHFFIDSVLWRFSDPSVRGTLLAAEDVRRRR